MHAGLMSSPGKSGSRTETGLGWPVISATYSRPLTFLVIAEVDGESNGEDGSWVSLWESCFRLSLYPLLLQGSGLSLLCSSLAIQEALISEEVSKMLLSSWATVSADFTTSTSPLEIISSPMEQMVFSTSMPRASSHEALDFGFKGDCASLSVLSSRTQESVSEFCVM
uniref:Uncharacterized protein n=1 Tax=Rhizophora mucronata TaxID=61149 RepID=A0A2P2MAE8_RHIMU